MDPGVVAVIGTLSGTVLGGLVHGVHAWTSRRSHRADSLSDTKRRVYAEYLRSISASYAQAEAGHWSATEEANLRAAAAEIEILAGPHIAGPAQDLVSTVVDVHKAVAANKDDARSRVPDVNRDRYRLIELFKADLAGRGRGW
jgi:hypothetical protein